jgi:alanine racemase
MHNTATARIDLSALRDNLGVVRRLCPQSRIMAMVKSDAYGHGLVPAAKALHEADGLAVARLEEALALRDAGIARRLLLLGTLLDAADLALCSRRDIDVTAHDATSVAAIAAALREHPLRVWIKLDSGMHRVGLDPEAFIAADRLLRSLPGAGEVTHMTHFSSADDPDHTVLDAQLACFSACRRRLPAARASIANSAALIRRPETHLDWVRPGIMLYGGRPLPAQPVALRPAMTLAARVLAVRSLGPGQPVGYNGRWISARASRVATIGIGYGDGYPRQARNGTPVLVNGCRAPLAGTVSMDSLCVDVTDCGAVAAGDEAILWGPTLPAALVAEHSATIDYALFTALGRRVGREYTGMIL